MKLKASKKSHCRTAETKKRLAVRLHRIEGQVRGIERMIEEDAPCMDILRLLSSVSGALHGVWSEVLKDHMKGCIRDAMATDDEALVDELIEHLKKI